MRPVVCSDNSDLHVQPNLHGGGLPNDLGVVHSDRPNGVYIETRHAAQPQAESDETKCDAMSFAFVGGSNPVPMNEVPYSRYSADPLDFLTPAEAADLPDLDFPVPDQDVIPEMVFESDDHQPQRQHHAKPQPQQLQYFSGSNSSPMSSPAATVVSPGSTVTSPEDNSSIVLPNTGQSAPLIPIQSSVVAHARSGKLSLAAVQERRAKNTAAARRSRARRADKVAELRQEKEQLLAENAKLVTENQRLLKLVSSLMKQEPPY